MAQTRVKTPSVSVDAAAWLASIPIGDVAYVHGVTLQLMAIDQCITEAELYAEFARRAAGDPDANIVRE